MDWQIVAVVAAVLVPIGIAIYVGARERLTQDRKRIDDHIKEDMAAHERLARLETEMTTMKVEVGGLRERMHDLRNEVTQMVSSWFTRLARKQGESDEER